MRKYPNRRWKIKFSSFKMINTKTFIENQINKLSESQKKIVTIGNAITRKFKNVSLRKMFRAILKDEKNKNTTINLEFTQRTYLY